DRARREAELFPDRVRDRALEALAAPRVADLPRALRVPAEPRRGGRIVGADRELARMDERQARLRARRRCGGPPPPPAPPRRSASGPRAARRAGWRRRRRRRGAAASASGSRAYHAPEG